MILYSFNKPCYTNDRWLEQNITNLYRLNLVVLTENKNNVGTYDPIGPLTEIRLDSNLTIIRQIIQQS